MRKRMTGKMGKGMTAAALTLVSSAMLLAGCGGTQPEAAAPQESASNEAAAPQENASNETVASQEGTSEKAEMPAELSGNIAVNGSTSMEKVIGLLSEQFMMENSGVTITYDATGSGTGIEAAGNGTCDIGLASRDLKEEEKSKGLAQTTIAKDGIAIIVNEANPLEDLSVERIADIYTGSITSWSELGGDELDIACIGREAGSGTRDGFESITDTKDQCKLTQELTSTGVVIEAVKNSPNAIGYASFSDASGQEGIRVLTVDGVPCSEEAISDGSYPIQRNFNLITKDGAELGDAAQAFYDYMISEEAHELVKKAGVVPAQ